MSTLEEQNPEAKIAKIEAKTKTLEELEEDKLKAEIAKIEAETEALGRSPFRDPKVLVSLLIVISGFATTAYNWYNASAREETALVEEQGSISYSEGLGKRLNTVDSLYQLALKQLPENVAAAGIIDTVAKLPTKVVIQFRGRLTRELMTALQGEFNSLGMPAPRPERIDKEYQNSVRYFNLSDSSLVDPVRDFITIFFREKGCPINNIVSKFLEPKAPKGQIEVWIHHSCR